MVRGLNGRHPWLVACAALFALSLTLPAAGQSTGMVRGSVKDPTGKPVEGAKISIDADANNRHFETKSDKKGEFVQIGLPPGTYKVSAEKDKTVVDRAIREEILTAVFGRETGYKASLEGDVQVKKAVTLFPEAEKLAGIRKSSELARAGR